MNVPGIIEIRDVSVLKISVMNEEKTGAFGQREMRLL